MGVLDHESILIKPRRCGGSQTGELLARGVNHRVGVGTIVPTQPDIGARGFRIGRVHLKNRRQRQRPGERIVGLHRSDRDREVAFRWQSKTVSLRADAE